MEPIVKPVVNPAAEPPLPPPSQPVFISRTESSEIILQSDLNHLGHLFGGRLAGIIDRTAAISAIKHARSAVVTVSIDSLIFRRPVRLGSILTVRACVNRVFTKSMEVGVSVWSLPPDSSAEAEYVCNAYLTFAALDSEGKSRVLPAVIPESEVEKRRFAQAGIRREHRLALQNELGKK
jgi:acyl-CoA hydrolase